MDKKTREKFFYLRDNENKPLGTICVIEEGDSYPNPQGPGWIWENVKHVSMGIAFCSPNDNPIKRVGRGIARQRAWYAYHNQESIGLITLKNGAKQTMNAVYDHMHKVSVLHKQLTELNSIYRSTYLL